MRADEPGTRDSRRSGRPLGDRTVSASRGGPTPLPLAHGELSEQDARALKALKDQIQARAGFYSGGYKEKCFRRRLGVRMRARGVHQYEEYAELLDRDPEEYDRLLAAVTINVSKFFRNAEVWELLREQVVPELFAWNEPRLRIWSAGSAAGEEPYTMAIVLREYAERHGLMSRLRRFEIVGSDIDREVLENARRAEYGELSFGETPDRVRERWFQPGERYRLKGEIRDMVRFESIDLLTQELPRDLHLIFCRNVTIYFERDVQEALLHRLRDALVPGGYLVLGKVESLFGSLAKSFQPIANRDRVYRKL